MKEKGLGFVVTDAVKDLLAEKGFDPKYGARPLRKPSSACSKTRCPT